MKYNLDGVLIVEGKQDVCYLSSFINGLFFVTNGLDLSVEKINFLKEVSKVNKLIILTDNDDAGKVIRNTLHSKINGCFDIEISGKSRKNYKKNGVAESNMSELVNLLKNHFVDTEFKPINYELQKYLSLTPYVLIRKQTLISKYRLINGTIKSLENQLNMLKVPADEVHKFIEGINL